MASEPMRLRIGLVLNPPLDGAEVDPVKRQSRADINVVNQKGDLVAVATHVMRWVKDK